MKQTAIPLIPSTKAFSEYRISVLLLCILSCPLISNAGTISTSATEPDSADYFSDAFSTTTTPGNRGRIFIDDTVGGQSWTHTTTGGEDYYLNSITLLGRTDGDGENSVTESALGLELRIYDGGSVSDTLLGTISFGSGTFDSFGTYITFNLTESESESTIGLLTSGHEYGAEFIFTDLIGNTDSAFRVSRANSDSTYTGGAPLNGNLGANSDWVFFVNGTAIPEPSTYGLLLGVTGFVCFAMRHRRKST